MGQKWRHHTLTRAACVGAKHKPQIKTLEMGLGREPLNSPSHCATWAHLLFLLLTTNLTVFIGSLKINS